MSVQRRDGRGLCAAAEAGGDGRRHTKERREQEDVSCQESTRVNPWV